MTRGFLSFRQRGLIAVIASMVIVNLVYGLTLPLLSLVLDSQGISKSVIGLSIVAQACAGVVLAPFIPRLMQRTGAARLMQYATLLAAATLIVLGLVQDVYLWFPLRFLLGAAAAMLWSASEVVINELADDNWRGRIIGVYGSAGAVGFALGPLVLIMTGTEGLLPFAVTAAIIILASLPLILIRDEDAHGAGGHESLRRIFWLVPHIMLLNFVYAAAVEAFIAFFPLFGIHIGLDCPGQQVQVPLAGLDNPVGCHRPAIVDHLFSGEDLFPGTPVDVWQTLGEKLDQRAAVETLRYLDGAFVVVRLAAGERRRDSPNRLLTLLNGRRQPLLGLLIAIGA